jgi:uncharacterized tellurite resistance protein B-like protein
LTPKRFARTRTDTLAIAAQAALFHVAVVDAERDQIAACG